MAVTKIFIIILRTSSQAVVKDFQYFFFFCRFLPVKYHIDRRTARFMQKFPVKMHSVLMVVHVVHVYISFSFDASHKHHDSDELQREAYDSNAAS